MNTKAIHKIKLFVIGNLLWMVCLCFTACQQERTENKQMNVKTELSAPISVNFTSGDFIDPRDQNQYNWIQFENGQKWMMQNLNFKTKTSVCYDGAKNCPTTGQLYSWNDAINSCPQGWKLPSKEDWELLIEIFGGAQNTYKTLLKKSGLAFSFGGVYDKGKNKYSYIGKNGNYWTSTNDSQQAWEYNFSKDYQKLFALQESKELYFSCRCMEGRQSLKVVTNKKTNHTPAAVVTKVKKPIDIRSATLSKEGTILFNFSSSVDTEKKIIPIIKRAQLSAADLVIGKPQKNKKKHRTKYATSSPPIELQHSGQAYCYGYLIEENKPPILIYPALKKNTDNSDQADLIVSKPKSKKIQVEESHPSHLVLEPTNNSNDINKKIIVCLATTPISEWESIFSVPNTPLEAALLTQANKTILPFTEDVLMLEQNQLKYSLNLEDNQVHVFTMSIQE